MDTFQRKLGIVFIIICCNSKTLINKLLFWRNDTMFILAYSKQTVLILTHFFTESYSSLKKKIPLLRSTAQISP